MPIQTFNGFPRPIPDAGLSGLIKSVQHGTTNITATQNVTISAVDLTKSVIMITVMAVSAATAAQASVSAHFNSSTEITLTVGNATGTKSVSWEVIEFIQVKSLQTGTTAVTTGTGVTGTNTATVTSVNRNKSILYLSRITTHPGSGSEINSFAGEITNSTTLTFSAYWAGGQTITFRWFLVEFN